MQQSPAEVGYFINSSNDHDGSDGFWQPHSSSIDFCESNYLLTSLVVEPHNVWSSILGLSFFGFVGVTYGNPTREMRTFLVYFILVVIGFGSACLHASLHWVFQSFDELPMIYLVVCALYTLLEVDAPKGENKYPNLPKILTILSCAVTAIYFKFQHMYIIFLATFSIMTIMILGLHLQIAMSLYRYNRDEKRTTGGDGCRRYINNTLALRFYVLHHIAYTLLASPIWVLDQFHCGYLLPIYNNLPFPLTGMTLHVAWHICSGMGAHFFIQFLCACRLNTLGMTCDVRRILGIVPVVSIESRYGNGKEIAKKQT